MSTRLKSRHWPGKLSAGLVCGAVIALALSALFAWFGPGHAQHDNGRQQFTMWMVAPLWWAVVSAAFLFRSGRHAWGWLGTTAALLAGSVWLLRANLPA